MLVEHNPWAEQLEPASCPPGTATEAGCLPKVGTSAVDHLWMHLCPPSACSECADVDCPFSHADLSKSLHPVALNWFFSWKDGVLEIAVLHATYDLHLPKRNRCCHPASSSGHGHSGCLYSDARSCCTHHTSEIRLCSAFCRKHSAKGHCLILTLHSESSEGDESPWNDGWQVPDAGRPIAQIQEDVSHGDEDATGASLGIDVFFPFSAEQAES